MGFRDVEGVVDGGACDCVSGLGICRNCKTGIIELEHHWNYITKIKLWKNKMFLSKVYIKVF